MGYTLISRIKISFLVAILIIVSAPAFVSASVTFQSDPGVGVYVAAINSWSTNVTTVVNAGNVGIYTGGSYGGPAVAAYSGGNIAGGITTVYVPGQISYNMGDVGGGGRYYHTGGGGTPPLCTEPREVSNGKGGTTIKQVPVECPTDICPNIAGIQTTVPSGHTLTNGSCVVVAAVPAPHCDSFTASPTAMDRGQSTTLAWRTSNATAVTINNGVGTVGNDSSKSVSPTQTTTYTLTAANSAGTDTCTRQVVVQLPDLCPNLSGRQTTVPAGYTLSSGQCVSTSGDVCPNLSGTQTSVPTGYQLISGQCIPTGSDVCPNMNGIQVSLPSGYTLVNGQCVLLSTEDEDEDDVCPNISGVQTTLPAGCMLSSAQCVPISADDTCPRIGAPGLSITAIPMLIRSGDTTTITWEALNVSSCIVSGGGLSLTGKTGSRVVTNITESTTFTLSCETPIGTLTDTATVSIVPLWQEL